MSYKNIAYPPGFRESVEKTFGVKIGRHARIDRRNARRHLKDNFGVEMYGTQRFYGDDSGESFGADANQADFLGQGGVLPSVNPPVRTRADIERDSRLVNQQILQDSATRVANLNAPYQSERARLAYEENMRMNECMKRRGPECKYAWDTSVDWGLIPMGIKVLGTGAAVVTTGGALLAGAAGIGAAGLGAAALSFKIPDDFSLDGDNALAAVAAADEIIRDPRAREIIANTQAMAELGDKDAERGAAVLSATGRIRLNNVAPDQPLIPVNSAAKSSAVNRVLKGTVSGTSSGQVKALAADVRERDWFQRVKDWFGL